jgi:hypothetical protein
MLNQMHSLASSARVASKLKSNGFAALGKTPRVRVARDDSRCAQTRSATPGEHMLCVV